MAVEMKNLSLVFALLVVYLVLFVPYVVRVKVDQMAQVIIFFLVRRSAMPLPVGFCYRQVAILL
jgi:hypothetical protein